MADNWVVEMLGAELLTPTLLSALRRAEYLTDADIIRFELERMKKGAAPTPLEERIALLLQDEQCELDELLPLAHLGDVDRELLLIVRLADIRRRWSHLDEPGWHVEDAIAEWGPAGGRWEDVRFSSPPPRRERGLARYVARLDARIGERLAALHQEVTGRTYEGSGLVAARAPSPGDRLGGDRSSGPAQEGHSVTGEGDAARFRSVAPSGRVGRSARLLVASVLVAFLGLAAIGIAASQEPRGIRGLADVLLTAGGFAVFPPLMWVWIRLPLTGVWISDEALRLRGWWRTRVFARGAIVRVRAEVHSGWFFVWGWTVHSGRLETGHLVLELADGRSIVAGGTATSLLVAKRQAEALNNWTGSEAGAGKGPRRSQADPKV